MTQIDFTALDFSADAAPTAAAAAPVPARLKPLRRRELVEVSEQLSVMLSTGVTVADALSGCGEQAEMDGQAHVAGLLARVTAAVESGDDLSAALAGHPDSFPHVYVALVRAGERGGMMPAMIERAVGYLRDEQEIVGKVRGAMTYPAAMLGFAVVTTVSLLVFVLPRFAALYEGKEDKLPVPTKALMWLSDATVAQWHLILPGVALIAFAAWRWLGGEGGRTWWHGAQLRLPVVGPMYRRLHLSRGLRMLGTLGGAGVNLVDCLEVARDLATNVWFAALWRDVADQIKAGRSVSEPLRNSPLARALVPPAVAQMVRAGESGGRLAEVAERVAVHAERDSEAVGGRGDAVHRAADDRGDGRPDRRHHAGDAPARLHPRPRRRGVRRRE